MYSQMIRGVLEMCVLQIFVNRDYYGYDALEVLRPYFPNVKDTAFYVVLRRMHSLGYLEMYEGDNSLGPVRKYYRLTDKGKNYLNDLIGEWGRIKNVVETLGIKTTDKKENQYEESN